MRNKSSRDKSLTYQSSLQVEKCDLPGFFRGCGEPNGGSTVGRVGKERVFDYARSQRLIETAYGEWNSQFAVAIDVLQVSAYLEDRATLTIRYDVRYFHPSSVKQHYSFICPQSVSLCVYSLTVEGTTPDTIRPCSTPAINYRLERRNTS